MITVEQLIEKLEALHEDTGDQSLEVAVDLFNKMLVSLIYKQAILCVLSHPSKCFRCVLAKLDPGYHGTP